MKHFGWIVLLGWILVSLVNCSEDTDAGEISRELSERLTNALNFENGEIIDEQPPDGESGSDAPQISDWEGDELAIDAPFAFSIISSFSEPEQVHYVLVHVEGSHRYFRVEAGLAEGLAQVFGRVANDSGLSGYGFTLRFALQTADGKTGSFHEQLMYVDYNSEPSLSLRDEMGTITLEGEESFASGRPAGQNGSAFPQIIAVNAPDFVINGESITLDLTTSYEDEILSAIVTTPGNPVYKRVAGTQTEGKYTITGKIEGDELSIGTEWIFLFALENADGVGLYRSWTVRIGPPFPTDGDGETTDGDLVDGDATDGDTIDGDAADGDTIDGDATDGDLDTAMPDTWLDVDTGLTWESPTHADLKNWDGATSYCNDLFLDGSSDWRLPSINELRSLVRDCDKSAFGGSCGVSDVCSSETCFVFSECGGCAFNAACYKPSELQGTCAYHWSSTQANDQQAWALSYESGALFLSGVVSTLVARCVRGTWDQPDGDVDGDSIDGDQADGDSSQP